MHTFIFLVLMARTSADSLWSVTPMPIRMCASKCCLQSKRVVAADNAMEILSGGRQ